MYKKLKQNKDKVIGVIMTYNCERFIRNVYKRIPKKSFDSLILVDDGSSDGTVKIAKRLDLIVYSHSHIGYGGNIKFGLKKALKMGGKYIVEIHGDGQYDLSVIPQALIKTKAKRYDYLLGSRFAKKGNPLKDGMSFSRYFANKGLSLIDKIILGVNITEFHSGFRIYTEKLLYTIGFEHSSDDYIYSFENIAQARFYNLKIGEIPIRCDYITEHTSINIRKSVRYAVETFWVLCQYILARLGIRIGIFRNLS